MEIIKGIKEGIEVANAFLSGTYAPSHIEILGIHEAKDGTNWLVFGNMEIHHWPAYVEYGENNERTVTVKIGKTDKKREEIEMTENQTPVRSIIGWEKEREEKSSLGRNNMKRKCACLWISFFPFNKETKIEVI